MSTEDTQPIEPPTCNAIGYLLVGGAKVGLLRCTEPEGHLEERVLVAGETLPAVTILRSQVQPGDVIVATLPLAPHAARLEWTNDGDPLDWPEALDPDEDFDVEVDAIDGQPVNGTDESDGEPR